MYNFVNKLTILSLTASSDYVPFNTVLTFPAGSTRQCTNVMILDDDVVEPDEVVNMIATLETAINLVSIGNNGMSMITILDFDSEHSKM